MLGFIRQKDQSFLTLEQCDLPLSRQQMPRKQKQPNQMQESELQCQPRTWECRQTVSLLFLAMPCFGNLFGQAAPSTEVRFSRCCLAVPSLPLCTFHELLFPLTLAHHCDNHSQKSTGNWEQGIIYIKIFECNLKVKQGENNQLSLDCSNMVWVQCYWSRKIWELQGFVFLGV